MATFLYAWELGGGLGHVLPFRPIAQALLAKGHRVVAALRDLVHVEQAFGGSGVDCLPAPHKNWRTDDRIEPLLSFAHILHNTGWSRASDLRILTGAWGTILDTVRPDTAICDHCPALLLALRGQGIKHATFGTGFCVPPDKSPWPAFGLGGNADPEKLLRDETHVRQVANGVLAEAGQPPLERLAQLYAEADDQILTTFAELDHYPQRPNARYSGWWPTGAGRPFNWPQGNGPKVYAYFKEFPALSATVRFLREQGWPTVIFAPGLLEKLRPLALPSLVVTDTPLDLQQVGREADLVIHNGTHGMLAELLLVGKPALSVPLTTEQAILAQRVAESGAGLSAANNNAAAIVRAMHLMLQDVRYADAARGFAQQYSGFNSVEALNDVVDRLEGLVK